LGVCSACRDHELRNCAVNITLQKLRALRISILLSVEKGAEGANKVGTKKRSTVETAGL
jgi:hypothetical protein